MTDSELDEIEDEFFSSTSPIMTIYTAHGDGGERGTGPIIGFYSNHYLATVAAKGKGWYGGNGEITERKSITVNGKYYLLDAHFDDQEIDIDGKLTSIKEETRKKALARLTKEEKEALGFK